MMRRAAIDNAEVNIGTRSLRESLKKVFGKLGLKIPDSLRADFPGDNAVRSSAEIDRGGRKRFVHRHQEISGAEDSALVADRLGQRLTERDAGVFDGVVLIDVEVAFGFDREIEGAVAGNEIEHVIEETDAGGDFGCAATVEIQAQFNLRLVGFAIDGGGASTRHLIFGLGDAF